MSWLFEIANPQTNALSFFERRLNEPKRVRAEFAHDLVVIGLFDSHGLQPVFRQPKQARIGVSHQQGRMGGHDHLAILGSIHATHQLKEFDLARRRQRRFRLIEDVDALVLAALLKKTQEALAVRMRAQANVTRRVIAREGGRSSIAEEPMINRQAAAYWIPAFAGMTAGPTTNATCLRMRAQQ